MVDGAFQRQLFRILQTRAATGITERTFSAAFGQFVIYVDEAPRRRSRCRGSSSPTSAAAALPHHRGPRGPPAHRRGEPPDHVALPRRRDQRDRRRRPPALPPHRLQPLRHDPPAGVAARRGPKAEKPEKEISLDRARSRRPATSRSRRRSPRPTTSSCTSGSPCRWPRSSSRSWASRSASAGTGRARGRARREPGHRGLVLLPLHDARGPRAQPPPARGARDLDANLLFACWA